MIQRIQTLYLLAIVLLNALFLVFYGVCATENCYHFFQLGSLLLAGFAVFSFKKRHFQFVLNRINILCNLILLGVLVYLSLNSSGEISQGISEKGVEALVSLFSIVFLFLANRAIRRDEDLVKSVDRLR